MLPSCFDCNAVSPEKIETQNLPPADEKSASPSTYFKTMRLEAAVGTKIYLLCRPQPTLSNDGARARAPIRILVRSSSQIRHKSDSIQLAVLLQRDRKEN